MSAFDRIHWAMNAETDSTSKHILLLMVIHADNETGYFYAKQSTLAREGGYKRRQTVSDHAQTLSEAGFIDFREQTDRNGYRKNHEYLVLFRDGLTWPDGSLPRVCETNTGNRVSHLRETNLGDDSHVRETDTAMSASQTSPGAPNEHAVSVKRTRHVRETDSINKPKSTPKKNKPSQTRPENRYRARDDLRAQVTRGVPNRELSEKPEPAHESSNGKPVPSDPDRMANLRERAKRAAERRPQAKSEDQPDEPTPLERHEAGSEDERTPLERLEAEKATGVHDPMGTENRRQALRELAAQREEATA
jgi:hypothetical protein